MVRGPVQRVYSEVYKDVAAAVAVAVTAGDEGKTEIVHKVSLVS